VSLLAKDENDVFTISAPVEAKLLSYFVSYASSIRRRCRRSLDQSSRVLQLFVVALGRVDPALEPGRRHALAWHVAAACAN